MKVTEVVLKGVEPQNEWRSALIMKVSALGGLMAYGIYVYLLRNKVIGVCHPHASTLNLVLPEHDMIRQ